MSLKSKTAKHSRAWFQNFISL